MPSPRRRRGGHGGRRGHSAPTAPVSADEAETRTWAELPLDAISAILHKLEPWRRINMLGHADLDHELNFTGMAQAVVRRSASRCEAFGDEYAADHDFLLYLADQ
ncbi:U-box domain-containing protein 4 [Hordeum vulgare]|nr:U-box domain-containing protein 4 [Hordeum vulgare]